MQFNNRDNNSNNHLIGNLYKRGKVKILRKLLNTLNALDLSNRILIKIKNCDIS